MVPNIVTWMNVFSIRDIVMLVRVFANGPGDLGSISGRETEKMVLDASLLHIQRWGMEQGYSGAIQGKE